MAFDDPLVVSTIVLAALGAGIMIWFLIKKPALVTATKLLLLAGILIFPVGAAFTGNLRGYTVSQDREFCSSCHVMEPWTDDSNDNTSKSLASMHARNPLFGERNCYRCHEDYGMFGTILTKVNGMNHMYHYYAAYQGMPIDEALRRIALYKPYNNATCMHCHSTRTEGFAAVKDHQGADEDVRAGKVSCASEGCHGPAHPFSKKKQLEASDR
jgi:nitrate/TMAO reductase-like tetraheme cytochrome c subunit